MRTSISLFPALTALVSAICPDPISASVSLLLPHPPSALSYISTFSNGTFLYPQSSQSGNTRILYSPSGPLNETLIYTHSTNSSWSFSWNLTADTPTPPGIESYTHTLTASIYCPGNDATWLKWDSAACVPTDDGDREAAAQWLADLQKNGTANILADYGGGVANSTSCASFGSGNGEDEIMSILPIVPTGSQASEIFPTPTDDEGENGMFSILPIVPTGNQASEIFPTPADGEGEDDVFSILPIIPTGIQAAEILPAAETLSIPVAMGTMGTVVVAVPVPTGTGISDVVGNSTNGTVSAWAQPTMEAGAAAEHVRMGLVGLAAGIAIGVLVL